MVVVGIVATSVRAGSTPASANMDSSLSCSSSPPPIPVTVTHAPSPARFMATLAAPPGRSFCQVARTTGTGASGEMRSTSPQMYLSSITSPTTNTRALRHPDSMRAIMSGKLVIIGYPRLRRPHALYRWQVRSIRTGCVRKECGLPVCAQRPSTERAGKHPQALPFARRSDQSWPP